MVILEKEKFEFVREIYGLLGFEERISYHTSGFPHLTCIHFYVPYSCYISNDMIMFDEEKNVYKYYLRMPIDKIFDIDNDIERYINAK